MSLEGGLGHQFERPELLDLALTHRSVTSDDPDRENNERLEFLGDAVLQLVITHLLYEDYPALAEGEMAKVRAAVVSRPALAEVARYLDLGAHVELARGEERSGGRDKDSILADTVEAVIGAVYLDAGLEKARALILGLWSERVSERAQSPGVRDYKTRLQEILARDGRRPVYQVRGSGPDHHREFSAVVLIDGRPVGRGLGRTKKQAEQAAAEEAIRALGADPR